jgi:hypothetical protein
MSLAVPTDYPTHPTAAVGAETSDLTDALAVAPMNARTRRLKCWLSKKPPCLSSESH